MGVFDRPKEVLKNWVYKDDDTLDAQGNNLENVGSVSAENLVIGGDLYVLDGTINDTTDVTYSMGVNSREVIVLLDNGALGDNISGGVQINGDTGNNYDTIDLSNSSTTGSSFGTDTDLAKYRGFHLYNRRGVATKFELLGSPGNTGEDLGGSNTNVTGDITQFSIIGTDGLAVKARVYRRYMSV